MTALLAACLHSTRGAKRRGAKRLTGYGGMWRARPVPSRAGTRLRYLLSSVTSGSNWVRTEDQVLRQFEKSPDFRSAWAKIAHGIGN